MEMAPVWEERRKKKPFPSLPTLPWKARKKRELPTFPQLRRRLGISSFAPSSFNFNFDEKRYLHARYLLLPTCPFAQGPAKIRALERVLEP